MLKQFYKQTLGRLGAMFQIETGDTVVNSRRLGNTRSPRFPAVTCYALPERDVEYSCSNPLASAVEFRGFGSVEVRVIILPWQR